VETGCNEDEGDEKAPLPPSCCKCEQGFFFVLFSVMTGPSLTPNARGGPSYYVYILVILLKDLFVSKPVNNHRSLWTPVINTVPLPVGMVFTGMGKGMRKYT
jgi:hypothetical protein